MPQDESYGQLLVISDSDGITSAFELQPQGRGVMVNVKLHENADPDAVAHSFLICAYTQCTDKPTQLRIKAIIEKLQDIIQLKEIPF